MKIFKKIIRQLPLIRFKIFGARLLYFGTKLIYRSNQQIVVRNGIQYELDLTEGIDLSIFLFGDFQKHLFNEEFIRLPEKPVIFDIGANIGHMSLSYAKLFPGSTIFAFEPTDYAFEKFQKNLLLNIDLAKQIIVTKAFASETTKTNADIKAYASWKITGHRSQTDEIHPLHLGTVKKATQTPSFKLDDFVLQNNIRQIDFIKIDTDGHEIEVLRGAEESIKKFRPVIIFEAGLAILSSKQMNFNVFYEFFENYDHSLINSKNGHLITEKNYKMEIPEKSTTDILVIFK